MKDNELFKYSDYRKYLRYLSGGSGQRTGFRSKFASAIGCRSAYVTTVFDGHANLSLEQAELANRFLSHTKQENDFFILLVQKERAGTATLKKYFEEKLDQILQDRLHLTKRMGQQNALTDSQRTKFYSAWYYQATHIALTIPEWQTQEALTNRLGLTKNKTVQILNFLIDIGLARKSQNKYQATTSQIRLSSDEDHINQHHTNWRIRAMESLSTTKNMDWHYSGVFSLSEKDIRQIKERLLDQLQGNLKIVKDSKEESLVAMNIDFFTLDNSDDT